MPKETLIGDWSGASVHKAAVDNTLWQKHRGYLLRRLASPTLEKRALEARLAEVEAKIDAQEVIYVCNCAQCRYWRLSREQRKRLTR